MFKPEPAYIVTGGAGLIGSHCIQELNKRGINNILVVDHLSDTQKWKNLNGLDFQDYMEKNVFLYQIKQGVFNDDYDIKAVIHLGACSDTTEADASYLIKNNYEYSKTLCEWAVEGEFERCLRFVYASSAATYGDGSAGYSDSCDLKSLRPLNMYGFFKHRFDLWVSQTNRPNQIVGLKYFNVYGPNEGHKGEMRSMVMKAFEQIQATGCVKLFKSTHSKYADGQQERDFVYVKDAAQQTVDFALAEPRDSSRYSRDYGYEDSGIYNVGSGRARSFLDLVHAVFQALDKKPKIEFIDMPENLADQYQSYTCAELRERNTASLATTSLEEGVTDYVQNYLLKP